MEVTWYIHATCTIFQAGLELLPELLYMYSLSILFLYENSLNKALSDALNFYTHMREIRSIWIQRLMQFSCSTLHLLSKLYSKNTAVHTQILKIHNHFNPTCNLIHTHNITYSQHNIIYTLTIMWFWYTY